MNDELRGDLQDTRPGGKLLFTVIMVIIIGFVFQLIGMLIASLIFNLPITEMADLANAEANNALGAIKFVQIIGALGAFVFSAFLLSFFYTRSWTAYFSFKNPVKWDQVFLIIVAMIAVFPFINLVAYLNDLFRFPVESLETYFRKLNDQSEDLMMLLVKGNNLGDLFVNIFMIAIIPAIGEELVFRGLIQRHLQDIFRNHHIAVILASVIFSLGHFQIYSFLPRFFLGMILGYAFVYGRSIWYPVIGHLLNNFIGVMMYYLSNRGTLDENNGIEDFGTPELMPVATAVSVLIVVLIFIYWRRIYNTSQSAQSDPV